MSKSFTIKGIISNMQNSFSSYLFINTKMTEIVSKFRLLKPINQAQRTNFDIPKQVNYFGWEYYAKVKIVLKCKIIA